MVNVELINYTSNPQETIVKAIRTCYQSMDKQSEVSDDRLLRHIAKNDESPLEFATFTFLISNISRVTSHQIVRHRHANYAQKSQRYCSEEGFETVIPPSIEYSFGAIEIFNEAVKSAQDSYDQLIALGIKREDARYVLPNACTTQLVAAFNARSLRHFLKMRLSPRAQWEIRLVAQQMGALVSKVAPLLLEDLLAKEDQLG